MGYLHPQCTPVLLHMLIADQTFSKETAFSVDQMLSVVLKYITSFPLRVVIKCKNVKNCSFLENNIQKKKTFAYVNLTQSVQRSITLFEIGVVWENVNKILDHSVAEVVLLLRGKAKRRRVTVQKRLQTCSCTGKFDIISLFFFHLPQSEPYVVSACVNSWLSEKRPGGLQLSLFPEYYWGRWRYQSVLHRHWGH